MRRAMAAERTVAKPHHTAYGDRAMPAPLLARNLSDLRLADPPWKRIQRTLKWTMLAGMLAILAGVLP